MEKIKDKSKKLRSIATNRNSLPRFIGEVELGEAKSRLGVDKSILCQIALICEDI
jgi:hypothetical protein